MFLKKFYQKRSLLLSLYMHIQIRPLADIVHFKYARTYLLTYLYFIDISQSSVETHLLYGGMYYNNQIIANCLQSVPVKKFRKLINNKKLYTGNRWQ